MTDHYHEEWLIRKANRVLTQARNASYLKSYKHPSGRTLKIYRAERSRGYQSNYHQVPIYYLLIYNANNELMHGQTMTQKEWSKREPEFIKLCS